ncbi:GNAT family N-acetyltransferase, partial [Streptomyces sp. ISL-87]|uniref:GNAT family N-acetyltransferase n=2 Tax=unclassified Streptomyces TaxID=2593676 RepID=UPI001BE6B460
MIFRTATREDLPAILALLADDGDAGEPAVVTGAHERAFAAIEADARNEMLVLVEEAEVLGCLQLTYIPGLGQGGRERALVETVRIRPDRRGSGLGAELMRLAVERARERGCGLVQLPSSRGGSHPSALTEPCVKVALYTALVVLVI